MTEDDAHIPARPSAEGRRRQVNIRRTHRTLYWLMMVFAVGNVWYALNFWTSHPTFNPFNINKNYVGWVFFALGVSQLVFLNVVRDLLRVRIAFVVSGFAYFFWGVSNAQQWANGKASLQLPISFAWIMFLVQMILAFAPPINPATIKLRSDE